MPNIGPTSARLAQTSEPNVEPADRMMPTTIHLRGPRSNTSPTSRRSLPAILPQLAGHAFAQHGLNRLVLAVARCGAERLHAGFGKPLAAGIQLQAVDPRGDRGIFDAAHLGEAAALPLARDQSAAAG